MHTFTERGCDCPFREEWELIDSATLPNKARLCTHRPSHNGAER